MFTFSVPYCGAVVPSDNAFDLTVSFSAAGWLQLYHFGAAQALVDCGLLDKMSQDGKRVRFCGSSAGSLVAVCLASGLHDFIEARDSTIMYGEHYASSWLFFFCMINYLKDAIKHQWTHLMDLERKPDLQSMINNGSLEIYVTVLPYMKKKVIDRFMCYEDVVEAALASCCMAPFVGFPFRLSSTGEFVCDGGLAVVTPRIGEPNTISVSPFCWSSATVHPEQFVPVWWVVRPPGGANSIKLFALGYNNMLEALEKNGLITSEMREKLSKPKSDTLFSSSKLVRFLNCRPVCALLSHLHIYMAPIGCVKLAIDVALGQTKRVLLFCNQTFTDLRRNCKKMSLTNLCGSGLSRVSHISEHVEQSLCIFRVFRPILYGWKNTETRPVVTRTENNSRTKRAR
ncbi:hypothetical protein ERJ75_000014100 [Trypanosoma vivax]|uniref:PNPLA domain-containing protein n=1 Tax=Trypanosoma vivax (strain Y486) TaxID=1055687 RepID=G0TU50_TRYVY|nr:hypothetical protein TRVL_00149 [Trypanosoma vivax]KAH8613539.1 hypothetical protein ERJ75_000704100 [Trypanosoma vivax]KAH8620908.1 hypothetical protein ERJ75_000014100 [Trypanosoma vivax]CCC47484.1 conserved hypothetical protein [Trypanosoma vivax Y486]